MLSAMALPGSMSIPAVMTSLGSVTSNAAQKQSEVISLSGSEPCTNTLRKILASVSSLRHPISLACSSWDAGPGPVSARASSSGPSPMQASSASDRADCSTLESRSRRATSLPSGVGVFAGSETLELAAVAAGAVVGFSDSIAAAVGTGMGVGVRASGVGAEQATRFARSTRMVVVVGMRIFRAGGFLCAGGLHPPFYASPTSFLSVHLSAVWVSPGFTRTASARSETELVSGTVDALNSAGFLFQRLESLDCSAKSPPCLDPV